MSDKRLWELFEMVRDVINKIEPTEANTKRLTEWSQRFHADEAETSTPPAEAESDDDDDPHEHGTPARRRRR